MANSTRFQYRLQDVLVITLLSGIVPVVFVCFTDKRNSNLYIISILLSAVSGLFAIRSCNKKNLDGFRRAYSVSRYVGSTLALFGGFIAVCMILLPLPELEPSGSSTASRESAAVSACKAFADAEEIYFKTNNRKDGVHQYAQQLRDLFETTPGKKDVGLIDEYFADAEGEPGAVKKPHSGYCFKVLKAQGGHAKGGQKSYLVNGKMADGYALAAYPYEYEKTGYDTFIFNYDGKVYQKDLGEKTPDVVKAMTEFDPDSTWMPAE